MISRVISTSRLLKVGQERARRGNCFLQSASSGFLESWRRNCDGGTGEKRIAGSGHDRVGVDPQIINEGPAGQSFATG